MSVRPEQKCLEHSPDSEKWRCSSDGRRQTVPRSWSGDRESPVAQCRSTNGRDDESCRSRRAEVTTAVDVSRPTDALREVQRGRVVQAAVRQNTEAEAYPLWNSQPAGGGCEGAAWCVQNASRRTALRTDWSLSERWPDADHAALSSSS